MKELALTLPGNQAITAPGGVPTGGISGAGGQIVATSIQILLLIATILALFYLISGGFKWMTSGGDQEKLAGSRQTILFAIIGLGIVALSFTFMGLLNQFFHTDINLLSIPNT